MKTADFDYSLPPELIASAPATRGSSRLLHVDATGQLRHASIGDLPEILKPGDLVVVNNTRVIPARLFARKETGGRVEILLIEKIDRLRWEALARPAKRLRAGTRLRLDGGPEITVEDRAAAGRVRVGFSAPIEPALQKIGHVPLPPYIHRPDAPSDRHDYQTVFAAQDGAVAAPTAGLHFDENLVERIRDAGIELTEVTLHVGPGTFLPVTVEHIAEHRMESERYEISEAAAAAVNRARADRRRVVAVGTTVVRTLESAARAPGGLSAGRARTDIFISPGFDFRVVDLLLTNFHLPRSTLLMLASAFAGMDRVQRAYEEAVAAGYRFYSYGDATLLERPR